MITKKTYTPYVQPYRIGDNKPVSNEIYRPDNTNLNKLMDNVINSANPTDILNFFLTNPNNIYNNENGDSPIHIIINIDNNKLNQDQKIDIIKQLIKPPYNISLDVPNNKLETPLHLATQKQYEKIIHFLIEKKANINAVNGKMQNALHLALIPYIQPCEKKITPEPIVPVSPEQDKNTMHNEILSVFYNKNNLINTDIIKDHATLIGDFVKHNKDSLYSIDENNKPSYIYNPVDTEIANMKTAITKHIIDKQQDTNSIKKNISHELTKAITNISTEYENFVNNSLQNINIANQKNIDEKLKITDDANLDILLGNESKESVEKQINDESIRVYKETYGQINNIVSHLVKDFDPKSPTVFNYNNSSINSFNAASSIIMPDIKELSDDIDEIINAMTGIMHSRNILINNPNDNNNDNVVNDVINAFTASKANDKLKRVAKKIKTSKASPSTRYDGTKFIYKMLGEQLPYIDGQIALGISSIMLDADDTTIYDLILKLNVKYNNPYTKALKNIIEYVNNEFEEKDVNNQRYPNKLSNELLYNTFIKNTDINQNVRETINIVHNFSSVPIIMAVLNGINKQGDVDADILKEINGAYNALEKVIKLVKYDSSGNYEYVVKEVEKIKYVPKKIIDEIKQSDKNPFSLIKDIISEINKIINNIRHTSLQGKPINHGAIFMIKVLTNFLLYNSDDAKKMYEIIGNADNIMMNPNLNTFNGIFNSVSITKAAEDTFRQIAIDSATNSQEFTNIKTATMNIVRYIRNIAQDPNNIPNYTNIIYTAYEVCNNLNNNDNNNWDNMNNVIMFNINQINNNNIQFLNIPLYNHILGLLNNNDIYNTRDAIKQLIQYLGTIPKNNPNYNILYQDLINTKKLELEINAIIYGYENINNQGANIINMTALTNVHYYAEYAINKFNNALNYYEIIIDAVNNNNVQNAIVNIDNHSFRQSINNIKKIIEEIIELASNINNNVFFEIMTKYFIIVIESTNIKIATEKKIRGSVSNIGARIPNVNEDKFVKIHDSVDEIIYKISDIYYIVILLIQNNNIADKKNLDDNITKLKQLNDTLNTDSFNIVRDDWNETKSILDSLNTLNGHNPITTKAPTSYADYKKIVEESIGNHNNVIKFASVLSYINLRAKAALNTTTIPMLESVLKASKPYILQKIINDKKDIFDLLTILKEAFEISKTFPTDSKKILEKIKGKVSEKIKNDILIEVNKNPNNSIAVVTSLLKIINTNIDELFKLYPYDAKLRLFKHIIDYIKRNNNILGISYNDIVNINQKKLNEIMISAENAINSTINVPNHPNNTYSNIYYAKYAGKIAEAIAKKVNDHNMIYNSRYVKIQRDNNNLPPLPNPPTIDNLTNLGIDVSKKVKQARIKGIQFYEQLAVQNKLDEIKKIIEISKTLDNATLPIVIATFEYAINFGLYQKMNYNIDIIDDKTIKKDIIEHYLTLRSSLVKLDNQKDDDRIKNINNTISQHIKSLNLLMALNNLFHPQSFEN
jgi:hypothetical protein